MVRGEGKGLEVVTTASQTRVWRPAGDVSQPAWPVGFPFGSPGFCPPSD